MQFNKALNNIKSYEAGKPIEFVVREFGIKDIIKLASNENPYGTPPLAKQAIIKNAQNAFVYPDDSFFELKEKLSSRFNLLPENFIIGAGSDQILEFISFAVLNKKESVLMNKITFAMYEIYAKMTGAKIIKTDSISHNLDEFYTLYTQHKPKLIFICTPDNPTGGALKKEELFAFLQKIDHNTLVVIDGAYMEFAKEKDKNYFIEPKELIETFENVVYTGTFSKAYGLGGMRVGYGISNKKIIKILHKLRPPFNITSLSLSAAIASLDDEEFVKKSIINNFKEMKKYEIFAKENHLEFIESFTNFITIIFTNQNSKLISDILLKKGIILRDLSGYGLNAIRITIGTQKQNDIVLQNLKKILN